jgi:hypothetical protein
MLSSAIMRTATDFNSFYASGDPWGLSRATFRDKVLRDRLGEFVVDKSVLELGCGEGHLTQAIFDELIQSPASTLAKSRSRAPRL